MTREDWKKWSLGDGFFFIAISMLYDVNRNLFLDCLLVWWKKKSVSRANLHPWHVSIKLYSRNKKKNYDWLTASIVSIIYANCDDIWQIGSDYTDAQQY